MVTQKNKQSNKCCQWAEWERRKELLIEILCITDMEDVSGIFVCGQRNKFGGNIELVGPGVDVFLRLVVLGQCWKFAKRQQLAHSGHNFVSVVYE